MIVGIYQPPDNPSLASLLLPITPIIGKCSEFSKVIFGMDVIVENTFQEYHQGKKVPIQLPLPLRRIFCFDRALQTGGSCRLKNDFYRQQFLPFQLLFELLFPKGRGKFFH